MKIKGKYKSIGLILLPIVVLGLGGLFFLFQDHTTSNQNTVIKYFCNADIRNGDLFTNRKENFSNGQCQSSDYAFSGKYSCKCTVESIYGMSKSLEYPQALDTIYYSVWKKGGTGKGALVFSSEDNNVFKAKSQHSKSQKGWLLIRDTIILPFDFIDAHTLIYPYNSGQADSIYFDDLKIEIRKRAIKVDVETHNGASIDISLTQPNFHRIKRKRDEAMEIGLLFASKDDLVDADLKISGKEYNSKIRLKGDLLDHLQDDNWSFRIELKSNDEWNNMNSFSIHNSKARSHLAEWVMHELFKKERILTPDYDFIKVSLNEKYLGVYAYEQHFDDKLLEFNNRQLGPILRHNDDGFWDNVREEIEPFHWTASAQIELYNKRNFNDPEFKELFEYGQAMLSGFISGKYSAFEVFDLDLIAKYVALLELTHANHAQLLTNIRFYMNPVTGKLEPIAFDCFGSHLPEVNSKWTAIGEGAHSDRDNEKLISEGNTYTSLLFYDRDFYKKYMSYLSVFVSAKYLNTFQDSLKRAAEGRQYYIRSDNKYANYSYSDKAFFKKAEYTRKKIYPNQISH